ncbi:MAG: hypothetical protein AAGG00_20040 [Cyanobacteria bacterium P01_H01_bin.150]
MSTDSPGCILSLISQQKDNQLKKLTSLSEELPTDNLFELESMSNLELAQLPGAEIYQIKGGETNESPE